MEFRKADLDNGLTIVAEANAAAASMAAGFFVKTGSRDETPQLAGVSHFLEHMLFKGTDRRTALDVNREFDEMGANYNAFTSEENTVYFAAVLPESQTRLLDLLADLMRPSLRREDFDLERQVILDEIAVMADTPRFRVYETLMSTHFAGHPLGNTVLGTVESIRALQRGQMLDYFASRYSPGNMTVVGVGHLDFDAFVDKVAASCSHWPPADAPRQTSPPKTAPEEKLVVDRKLSREHVGLMSPAPCGQDDARYAAQLAAAILGDHTGSRLFYALVDPAICDEVVTAYQPMDRAGAMLTLLSADPDRAGEAVRIARREFHAFMDEGPTESELQAAKNKIATSATRRGELPMGRLSAVGFDWVYRREYKPLAEQIELLLAVTRQQIIDLARQYDLTATTTLCLGPMESL
jgi:predicted Zn-dependent peptidase